MKIPKRIIHKISRIIKDVSGVYAKALPPNQRHLLPELLFAPLRNPSVYVSDVARKMEGCSASIGAKEMKVLRPLHHPKVSLALPFYYSLYLSPRHVPLLTESLKRHRFWDSDYLNTIYVSNEATEFFKEPENRYNYTISYSNYQLNSPLLLCKMPKGVLSS